MKLVLKNSYYFNSYFNFLFFEKTESFLMGILLSLPFVITNSGKPPVTIERLQVVTSLEAP